MASDSPLEPWGSKRHPHFQILTNMGLSDFRYSARALLKNPAFAILAMLTIALSTGATTSIFTAVNGVLLKSFSFPEAERLVVVTGVSKSQPDMGVSYPDYLDWRAEQRVFVDLAGAPSGRRRDQRDRRARTSFRPVCDREFLFNFACSAADRAILRRRRRESGCRARLGDQRRIMAATFQCRSRSDRPRDQLQRRELDGHRRSPSELRFLRSEQWEQRPVSADGSELWNQRASS